MISEKEFGRLRAYSEPEILTANLSHTLLKLSAAGQDVESFPFYEAPDVDTIANAMNELKVLGAIDKEGVLTGIGKEMMKMWGM